MKRTKITDKITYVEPDSMAKLSSCAGMIVRSRKNVWIDMNLGARETLEMLENETPDAAIITHYHLDHSIWTRHVGMDAVVFIPEKEAPYLTSLDFVIEKTAGPFGMADQWKTFMEKDLDYKPLQSYECYNDQTTFKDLAPEIVVMETPGHSPAHTSFYFPDEKILFSGDMGLDRFGPWYGWSDCHINRIVDSILRLDGMDVGMVLTSHGGILRKGIQQAWAACIGHILDREEKIAQRLDAGMGEQDIIWQGVFYPDKEKATEPMKSFLYMWDTAMYMHHAALIKDGGLIKRFPEIKGMLGR